jgi:HSP20 family protein
LQLRHDALAVWAAVCDDSRMRSRVHAVLLPSEIGEFGDEVRRIFRDLGRAFGADSLAGECSPAIDVFETDETIEVAVDLPGVAPSAVHLRLKGDTLLVAGEKAARRGQRDASFHLVERGFGRFARAVRLGRPCDASRARARFSNGELRVTIPKIEERRGRTISIEIEEAKAGPGFPAL